MNVSLRVDGGQQLASHLRSLSTRLSNRLLREALAAGAEPMRVGMGQRAPRAAGAPDMADHMVISFGRNASVAVGPARDLPPHRGALTKSEPFYPYFQEMGTSRHGAQAFARPAFDADGPKAIPIVSGYIWRALISRGIGSARGPQDTSEPELGLGDFEAPSAPRLIGGMGGGGLL